ncbi:MAG: DNA translocase FtsK [Lachnospiraceae bacterium]|nr:DNA translocase FtsK [Lachnospiraceae bacterium]
MATTSRKPAARKNSSRSGSTGGRGRKQSARPSFRNEIILWSALAICIVLFLANFGVGGKVGGAVSSFFFGVFGLLAYVVPVILFIGMLFALSNKENRIAVVKIAAAVIFVAFLCLFVQMVTDSSKTATAMDAYTYSRDTKFGGGIIGGALEQLLCPNFGVPGTYVINIILLIISLVLMTERSIMKGVKTGGKALYDTAKDETLRRKDIARERLEEIREERTQAREEAREQARIRREEEKEREKEREKEQARRRMEKTVSGVALDTKITPPRKEVRTDEISEITMADVEDIPTIQEEKHVALTSTETEPAITDVLSATAPWQHADSQDMQVLMPEEIDIPEAVDTIDTVHDMPEFKSAPMEEPMVTERVKRQAVSEDTSALSELPVTRPAPPDDATIPSAAVPSAAAPVKKYTFPPVDLLRKGKAGQTGDSQSYLSQTAQKLVDTLKNFGVNINITDINCGPSVTRYEFQPEMGVKVSKIVNLADDIKLNLAAADIRIEAPIPGKAAIGIEIPNKESVPVMFRDLVESEEFSQNPSPIAFAAGKDIAGKVMIADIAKMPHLLIAGATGSGKSVCINTIIMSILYRAHPDDVKLIMIDPKVVELSVYNGIPHLLIPVVTDPKKAAGALHWAVAEMTERYNKFAEYGVRDLKGYNKKVEGIADIDDPQKPQKMPQIVIIVDELADLMMVAPGDVEDAICRLAQLARAAGLHLIIATQRPSVNVITGLIKANMPSRIAFSVTSGVDSRTILDMNGAEKLLGKGDMLYYPQGLQKPLRVQGAFVDDSEVSKVVDFLKENNEPGSYSSDVEERMNNISVGSAPGTDSAGDGEERDPYFMDAAKLLIDKDKGSIGMIQRYFKVGFNRAARIMDQLEEAGVVGPDEGTKPRQILMSPEQLEQFVEESF